MTEPHEMNQVDLYDALLAISEALDNFVPAQKPVAVLNRATLKSCVGRLCDYQPFGLTGLWTTLPTRLKSKRYRKAMR